MKNDFGARSKIFGLEMQQQRGIASFISDFLRSIRPKLIVEFGAGHGGLSALLSLYSYKHEAKFHTFENSAGMIEEKNRKLIEFMGGQIHDSDIFSIESFIGCLIAGQGRCLVLCDNGNKKLELSTFAKYLKPGDFIMAHDYYHSKALFDSDFTGRGSCELEYKHIEETISLNGLEIYSMNNKEKNLLWVLLEKTRDGN